MQRLTLPLLDYLYGAVRQLTNARGYDAEGAYSPDGEWIVFSSTRNAFPSDKLDEAARKKLEVDPAFFAELFIMRADGSGQRQLTDWPGYDGGPFFSPDGKRVVFRHFNEEGTIADVYTIKVDGTDRQRVTDFGCMSWAPYYHPSGDYIIFTANKHGFGNFELFNSTGFKMLKQSLIAIKIPCANPFTKAFIRCLNRHF